MLTCYSSNRKLIQWLYYHASIVCNAIVKNEKWNYGTNICFSENTTFTTRTWNYYKYATITNLFDDLSQKYNQFYIYTNQWYIRPILKTRIITLLHFLYFQNTTCLMLKIGKNPENHSKKKSHNPKIKILRYTSQYFYIYK